MMNESNPQQPLPDDDDTIDLRQLFGILFNNKLLILFFILLFFGAGYVYVQGQKPVYQANALIQIEQKSGGLTGLSELTDIYETDSGVATEIEIIQSRFVLGKVVDEKTLQIRVSPRYLPFARYAPGFNDSLVGQTQFGMDLSPFNAVDASIQLTEFALPSHLYAQPLTLKVISDKAYDLYDASGEHLLSGSVGLIALSNDGEIKLSISSIQAHPGAEFVLSLNHRIDEIDSLRGRLQIKEQGKNTGILSIALEGTERGEIRETLNSIIEAYQAQNVERESEEARSSITFLQQQVPQVKQDLEAAERAANEYRATSSRVNMEVETETTLQRIVAIEGKLNELKLKETEISTRYKKDHPIYATLLKQRRKLLNEHDQINQQIEKLPAKQQELLTLMRDVEVTNAIYLQLLNKMEALKVVQAGTIGNVRILDSAEVLTRPVRPKKQLILLITLFAGGMFGAVIAFMRVWLNPGLVNPAEVQDALGLAKYGVIPVSQNQRRVDKGAIPSNNKPAILAITNPEASALEAVRSIRTSLHFAMLEAKNNLVMLTSPSPGAGKSFISANLATLVAQSGQKVLLVDIDMRRGHINKSFHLDRQPGLSDLLSGDNQLEEVIHSQIQPGLDFIATGSIPPNPSELIMSAAFTRFLHQIQQTYDIVIIDTPPILAVTDAALIGHQVGTCMLVVRHKMNSLREVQQAKIELERMDTPLKGYIYNCAELKPSDHYYYYYDYAKKTKQGKSPWRSISKAFKRVKKSLSR